MTDNPWVIVPVTILLIAMSAFFVAIEFALIAARRHRIEDAAANSRSARAALRSASELSVLLAGSQLGITVCTLALGAITKPAVHHWITPGVEALGAPLWVADVAGFVLALIVVTFLHLVVGEMAPKSWAIAHPERSAIMLALPMRGFMFLTRPIIVQLNNLANFFLHKVGVNAVDQVATGQDKDTLRQLVEHSAETGTLDERYHAHLASALELESLTVGDVASKLEPSDVALGAGPAVIQEEARRTGHLRLLVREAGAVRGVVHVRDSLAAPAGTTAGDLMRPVLTLDPSLPVYEALGRMREKRSQLAIVAEGERVHGLLSLDDVLTRLLATTS